ncbi:peptidase M24, structural domain-containing protein, partial [Zopfochytrium polystomum]
PATVAFVVPAFEARRAAAIAARAAAEVPPALHTWEEDGSAFDVVRGLLGRAFIHTGLDQPSVGLRAVDGTFLVAELRAVKSAAEVSLLRHASVATKAAVAAVARSVSAGMTEAAVGAMVRGALRAAGLGDPWALVLFDQDAAFPHGTEGGEDGGDGGGEVARLRDDGSVVLIDAGGDVHGYQSDVTRTFWFAGGARRGGGAGGGAGSVAAIAAAAAADGAGGAKCGAVDAAARDEIARRGYGPGYRYFTHRLGHGIGLDGHEPPYMTRGAERLVAAGNAFTVEPGVYVAGEFGVRIEDMVVVVDEEEEGEGGTVRRSVVVLGAESKSIDDPFDGHL